MNLNNILIALPNLSPPELRQVTAAAQHLMGNSGPTAAPTGAANELFQALQAELSFRGIEYFISYERFSKAKYFKAWELGVKNVDAFYKKHFSEYFKTQNERLGFQRFLISILIDDLTKRKIPITLGTVASNIGSISKTFDRAFPNYIECGLANLIPLAMKRRRL